jgi:dTDP-4-dehydrorhamnose reductase
MKEVYVTGSAGLVGSRFVELLPKDYTPVIPEIKAVDITDKDALEKLFRQENFDAVVNFAAFTNVSEAEKQRGDRDGDCWKINVEGAKNLAEVCKKYGVHLIQISTDYVFPGTKDDPGPYDEGHRPEDNPERLTWYGYTKAEAERQIKEILGDNVSIVRLIYPVRADFDEKLDYIRKPLDLWDKKSLYALFDNQQISITYIDEACEAINKIIGGSVYGIFHASTPDTTTPYELIRYVVEKARRSDKGVTSSSLDDNQVRYPKYGGLRVESTERRLGIKFSPWRGVVKKLAHKI